MALGVYERAIILLYGASCALCLSGGILKPRLAMRATRIYMGADIVEMEFTGAGTVMVASPYEFGHTMSNVCVLLYDCTTEKAQGVILQVYASPCTRPFA